jgi:hypothetical protein
VQFEPEYRLSSRRRAEAGPANPRRHTKQQIRKIADSIRPFRVPPNRVVELGGQIEMQPHELVRGECDAKGEGARAASGASTGRTEKARKGDLVFFIA